MFASGSLMSLTGSSCSSGGGSSGQPAVSTAAANSIPADYLTLFQEMGKRYGIPWVILAGIGKVESDDGRTTLPGVHSGSNAFGAAGPMQIGIRGAAGIASVYEAADAIAGAAKYLLEHGVLNSVPAAIFAYNHLESYVQAVLYWAGVYARGGYTISAVTLDSALQCMPGIGQAPNDAAAAAISYAELQLGKPYQWSGTGPDSFDCSGLVMMAYRAAGIDIPRTSQQQWAWGPRVSSNHVQPGDLVFFAGADGTRTAPGHVGIVIGGGLMIEAYATGFPIRVAPYGGRDAVGFTRPWAHSGVPGAGSH
jgi:cell wall-associated NlpC family hydrolase